MGGNTMQPSLFHERIEDALDEVIRVCGGRKEFACEMWPDKPQREAHNLLDACLNPERREKFSPSQIIYILKRGRGVGCHSLMFYISRECEYEARPIIAAEEVDRLTSVIESSTKTLAAAMATLERIQQANNKAVR
jgi:hypothetical protein